MTLLFIGTLKGVAFEWFLKLSTGSIKTWTDLEKLFLARFFEDDIEISVPTLLAAKQKKRESIMTFVERFQSMVLRCPSDMTQSRHVTIICKLPSSLKWEWQNDTVESSWCYKANRRKKLSPGSGLKKKTANQDPTN